MRIDLDFIGRRLDAYERLLRLDKPIGTLLLLWPTLWAVWLASRGFPGVEIVAIFGVGTLLMRSAGCALNDFADRKFDAQVERTRNRPLATGEIAPAEALALAGVLVLAAFFLVLQLNWLTVSLSFVALGLTVIYPYLKRFFPFPQAWLGVAFGFSIPMAYAAQLGYVHHSAWALLAANVFWAIAYDTEYAMVDRDDDARLGLKSSAILLGHGDVAGVMVAPSLFVVIMVFIGWWQRLDVIYFAGLAVAAAFIVRQYFLIRGRDRGRCFQAFHNNNWVGLAIFAGLALDLFFLSGVFR